MSCNFNPNDFLEFSKFLQSVLSCQDALKRSAISRAYYSAFLTARERIDILAPDELNHETFGMHSQVRRALRIPRFRTQDSNLHRDLNRLTKYRFDADYKFHNANDIIEQTMSSDPHDMRIVNRVIFMAEDIIQRINNLS